MIKLIPTEKLQTGMFIHDLNWGWMDHNFVRSPFAVKTEAVALKVRALGVKEIYIDTARGLDIVEGPSQEAQEHQVEAALQALATTSASDMPRVSVQREVERAQKLHGDANRIVRDVMGTADASFVSSVASPVSSRRRFRAASPGTASSPGWPPSAPKTCNDAHSSHARAPIAR